MTIEQAIAKLNHLHDRAVTTQHVTYMVTALRTEKTSDIRKYFKFNGGYPQLAQHHKIIAHKDGTWSRHLYLRENEPRFIGTTAMVLKDIAKRLRVVLTKSPYPDAVMCTNDDVDALLRHYNLEKYKQNEIQSN